MELTHSAVLAVGRPSFIFTHDSDQRRLREQAAAFRPLVTYSWQQSQLNPKNRINSLSTSKSRWRIDGSTLGGTQFFAVPICLLPHLTPLRIDVFTPDQDIMPSALRELLDIGASVVSRDSNIIANLGISRHLCLALDSYCDRDPHFLESYHDLPFASKLVFSNISTDVSKMDLTVLHAHELERASLSIVSLRRMWKDDLHGVTWPEVIDITSLQLVKQLHDSISVVRLIQGNHTKVAPELIFKSNTRDFHHLYHELKFLMTCPPHPHILKSPIHIVTKKCRFGGKHGVLGFTLDYHQLSSIRDLISDHHPPGDNLTLTDKVSWSWQITSALIHIREQAGTFYSDLRPDNILISSVQPPACQQKRNTNIVLCDFEQRGNWHEWCAPEVLFRQYIENIRPHLSTATPNTPLHRWSRLVEAYTDASHENQEDVIHARNRAWFSLSPRAQEKAQVYNLGLFLYCLFECLSNVRVNIANSYPGVSHVEFPHFRRTPAAVQDIIKACTVDAPEWTHTPSSQPSRNYHDVTSKVARRVVRIGDMLFPEGQTNHKWESPADATVAVLDTAMAWWTTELGRAEQATFNEEWLDRDFGKQRPTLREVLTMIEKLEGAMP